MSYFILQVETGREEVFLTSVRELVDPSIASFYWPRRSLRERRKGKTRVVEAPLFPGYLVAEAPQIGPDLFRTVRRAPSFIRFLRSNDDIQALVGSDLEMIRHFLGFGEIAQRSRVRFDENQRIHVVDGPMAGLEGRIVKVDRRKGRAKIRLDLYNNSFLVDLGFEVIHTAHAENDRKTQ